VFWFKGAPDVTNLDNETDEKKSEVVEYFSNLITAVNPNRNDINTEDHPCRKRYEDIIDVQKDLGLLLNKVQRHTKCSMDYCLRVNRTTRKMECRFKFPAEMKDTALLQKSEITNEYEFFPERNDPLLNKFNKLMIQLWRANIDISPVISKRVLLAYLTKYISKSEKHSATFDELMKNIIASMTESSMAVSAIRKFLVKSCAERDVSAQEVCHSLLGLKLHSSGGRQFTIIKFKTENWMKVPENENEKDTTNFLEKYQARPMEYEDVTLFDAAKKYSLPKWSKVRKQNIVRVFPKLLFQVNGDNTEYYKQKVLLHTSWRSIDEFDEMNISWKELSENISDSSLDLGTLQSDTEYECDEELAVTDDDDEDFMLISKLGSSQLLPSHNLGKREIDLNYNWNDSLLQYEQYGTLSDFENFIQDHKKREVHTNGKNSQMPSVTFSNDQLEVIKMIDSQVVQIKNNEHNTNIPKRILVQGKAGNLLEIHLIF